MYAGGVNKISIGSIFLLKNPTNALIYIYIYINLFIHTFTLLHVSAFKGPSSGSTDTMREHGQQNTCPDVNIRLKSSVWFMVHGSSNVT